jgi:hypothetical protein
MGLFDSVAIKKLSTKRLRALFRSVRYLVNRFIIMISNLKTAYGTDCYFVLSSVEK